MPQDVPEHLRERYLQLTNGAVLSPEHHLLVMEELSTWYFADAPDADADLSLVDDESDSAGDAAAEAMEYWAWWDEEGEEEEELASTATGGVSELEEE